MSNIATFTLHIRNVVKMARDKMRSVMRAFHSWKHSIMKYLVIPPLEYCYQLWNPWKAKDIQAIETIQQTFTYKITEVQHLNYWKRLHKLKLYSLQRWMLYNYIYLEDNTVYGAKYWWYNETQNRNQKTFKMWNTVSYSETQQIWNRKPAQSLQENAVRVFLASVVQLVAKISERHWKC